jgi:DNA-binding transcriptional LysR family regulator
MDTLTLIKTFREVAARGGFSRAAKALDISKANVSKYVAALETRLGARLLNRTTRTVSLTHAGTLLLARSTPLLEMIDMTRDELGRHARQPSGRLRLTAPIGLGQVELPALLGAFIQRYPDVHISLDLTNHTLDLVDEGIDIALRVGHIRDSNLIVRKLKRMNMVLCATPSYWASHGIPSHPDEVAEHDALTHSMLGSSPEWRFLVNGVIHPVPVRSRMDASDAAPLIHLALQDLGVLNLPELLVRDHLASGALQAVLSEYQPDDRWMYAAYTQRRHNSAAIKSLLAFMEEQWRAEEDKGPPAAIARAR